MPRLLLIRHGETVWNHERRFQGVEDVPLSEKGREQARLLAVSLRDEPLAAIYSSPLSRALDTAKAVRGQRPLEIQREPRLQEIDVGEWAGLGWEEIWERWPDLGRRWHANPSAAPAPPGGEYYPDFQERAMAAMEAIAAAHGDKDLVAVVSHGGVIRAVMNKLFGLTWGTRGRFFISNCSITRMRWQPEEPVVLAGFNDLCHLKGIEGE